MSDPQASGFPLTQQQQRIFERMGDRLPANYLLLDLGGTYNRALLENAIEHFVAGEENLHTVLAKSQLSKLPLQDIRDEAQVELCFVDCTDRQAAIRASEQSIAKGFDRDTETAIRFEVWQWSEQDAVLLLSASPFFSDFQSWSNWAKYLDQVWRTGTIPAEEEEDLLQYVDYSEWEREAWMEATEEVSRYWQGQGDEAVDFNAIFAEDTTTETTYDCHDFILAADQVQQLQQVAETKGVTLEDLMMTLWWRLLKRYSEKESALVYLFPNRMEGETDHIFGLFEKGLCLSPQLMREQGDLWGMAAQIKRTRAQQSHYHTYYHYGKDRESGEKIAYPHQFAWRNAFPNSEHFKTLAIASHPDDFEFKLEVIPQADQSLALYVYARRSPNTEHWPATLAQQLQWQCGLTVIRATEGETAWQNARAEQGQAAQQALNGNIGTSPSNTKNLIELLDAAVAAHPDKRALVYGIQSWDYAELDRRAKQLAQFITDHTKGARNGVIAVQVDDPRNMILAFISISRSGNAFLPLDGEHPLEHHRYIIEQSEATLLIAETEKVADFPNIGIAWSDIESKYEQYPAESPAIEIDPQDPCYLIYTSGTTGRSKGVVISHANIVNYLEWVIADYEISAEDRTVLFSSMAFDLGHTIIWSALSTGAELHLCNPAERLDFLEQINPYLLNEKITYLKATPSHFKLMLNDPEFAKIAPQQALRFIILGGEHIDTDDLQSYFAVAPEVVVVNEYGPTETTIGIIAKRITAKTIAAFSQLPVIGRAFGYHRVVLLDSNQNAVLPGEYGALYLAGPGLATAYHHRPELTEKAFPYFPYAGEVHRFYSTGDLGRFLPNGDIQLAGRIDEQIKVRGYRIEPAGISNVIGKLGQLQEAYTMAEQMDSEEVVLWTFVVAGEESYEEAALRRRMEEKLPSYMVPDQLFELDALPLNPNGKVDRGALRKYAQEQLQNQVLELPQTAEEKIIARIWCDLLKRETVGMQQRFFQIGGHSLMAMKMLARVHQQLNVRIQLVQFFQHPTIESLVGLVQEAHQEQVESIQRIAAKNGRKGHYDLSMAQKRIWMHEQLKEKDGTYNIYFACRVSGGLELERLENALRALVERQENFRTHFVEVDGLVQQKILDPAEVNFKVDTTDRREYELDELQDAILEKCKIGFDLAEDILFRCQWLKTTVGDPVIVFAFHHIIMDEWSIEIFERELMELLSGTKVEELAPMPIQYKDFAAWENIQLREDRLQQMKLFFERQFSGELPIMKLPTDMPRGEQQSYGGDNVRFEFTDKEYAGIMDFCAREECSPLVFCIGLTKALLYRLTQQTDLIIGTLEANRNHPDLENIIGCFFNILPIRSQFPKEVSFNDLLRQVKEQFNATLTYSLYPFNFLLRDLQIKPEPGRAPLFDVMVSIRSVAEQYGTTESIGDLEVHPMVMPSLSSKYDLLFDFVREPEGMRLILEFNRGLFHKSTMEEYLQLIHLIMDAVIEQPQVAINQIGFMAEVEDQVDDQLNTFFNF